MKIIATKICPHTEVEIWHSLEVHLDEARRNKIGKCLQKKQQQRMIIGDILLRYALQQEFGSAPGLLRIGYGPYGKPWLYERPEVFFNISHAGEWVAVALGSREVGIDVEIQGPRFAKLADCLLSPSELRDFQSIQDQDTFLCRRWVMKESFVKMIGLGLGCPLTSVSFVMISHQDAFTVYEEQGYFCRVYELASSYPLAVSCADYRFPDQVTILPFERLLHWALVASPLV
ncbi:4'-phosphopantetheinyl transferase superfamily protein [Paenibacillus sp. HWE-109]|uniref:4'-phosphopantetheinyl transferase family protein n=1 Tax=Paenibacillus sp. HWE-109 TaxID=1306526 RepID=UPI001EDFF87C|nr:4'-phosphopantetheinyl transferase superfamily protein [Paenibacillus sp. HWE-109]UKS26672.1 4'-phosphopantetheinyl transferase superfamily protein [Paenibacillus sp. HWE-109]